MTSDPAAHLDAHVLPSGLVMRRAVARDVRDLRELVKPLAADMLLVEKPPVAYFESLAEFRLVVDPGPDGGIADGTQTLVGCAALHVMWEDLAEIRTVATNPDYRGRGAGKALVAQIVADARAIGVRRVFCLTFETGFFGSFGFREISGTPVSPDVYGELLQSHDEGTAEFLDLARVKPNTLGNTRMILDL
ncbi:amino-acid N-acetyltransferase [Brevibacterium litoralis]|uniref:amino-acid N-acetyltransferase n=1 Tax=Brevibacterium litoralis TaxID=3138935 RepID=UPI0032ECFEC0